MFAPIKRLLLVIEQARVVPHVSDLGEWRGVRAYVSAATIGWGGLVRTIQARTICTYDSTWLVVAKKPDAEHESKNVRP